MKKLLTMFMSLVMIFTLIPSALAVEVPKEPQISSTESAVQEETDNPQPNNLYDYAWIIDSVTVTKTGYGPWRVGPTGLGPGTLNINDSKTVSRTYTNEISGSYSIGKSAIGSKLGVSIGVAQTHGTSYSINLKSGERKTIIFRPKTKTTKVVTGYYKIPVGIVGAKKQKLKEEICYVTSFVSWDYSWRSGY